MPGGQPLGASQRQSAVTGVGSRSTGMSIGASHVVRTSKPPSARRETRTAPAVCVREITGTHGATRRSVRPGTLQRHRQRHAREDVGRPVLLRHRQRDELAVRRPERRGLRHDALGHVARRVPRLRREHRQRERAQPGRDERDERRRAADRDERAEREREPDGREEQQPLPVRGVQVDREVERRQQRDRRTRSRRPPRAAAARARRAAGARGPRRTRTRSPRSGPTSSAGSRSSSNCGGLSAASTYEPSPTSEAQRRPRVVRVAAEPTDDRVADDEHDRLRHGHRDRRHPAAPRPARRPDHDRGEQRQDERALLRQRRRGGERGRRARPHARAATTSSAHSTAGRPIAAATRSVLPEIHDTDSPCRG